MKILPWQTLTYMFNDTDMAGEMSKKYKGTVIQIINNEDSLYGTYEGYDFTETNDIIHKIATPGNDNWVYIPHKTDLEIVIPNPRRGLYNTYAGIGLFYRLPFRQHKRGLYTETAFIGIVVNQIFGKSNNNRFAAHIYEVLDKKKQQPVTIDEAKQLCNTTGSYAINRDFGLIYHPSETDGFALLYENCYVGRVLDNTILVKNPVFYQEVLDALPRIGPTYSVRLAHD